MKPHSKDAGSMANTVDTPAHATHAAVTATSSLGSFLAGGVAGCTAKTAVAPIDRVKILFQTNAPEFRAYQGSIRGAMAAASHIYASQGVPGLFRGHSATLLRIFPYAAIKYMAFEKYSQLLIPTRADASATRNFAAGSMAGATAIFFTYPLELIRVKLAYQATCSPGATTSFARVVSDILRQQPPAWRVAGPPSNFFRGFMPTLYGVIPYAGITFVVYQDLKARMERANAAARAGGGEWPALVAGAAAGAAAQTLTYPLEIVRRQIQVARRATTTADMFRHVFRQSGARGFFVGLALGYVKMIPMTMISFWSYELAKGALRGRV